jgi:hypothetical protein
MKEILSALPILAVQTRQFMKKLFLALVFGSFAWTGFAQTVSSRNDPKFDTNLSPNSNHRINPDKNSSINPKYNWNINPSHNFDINPLYNYSINPANNVEMNPEKIKSLNPMFHNELHPKNPAWAGRYIFNKSDELIGFLSVATQQVMLSFDANSEWNGYYVKAGSGNIYNFFDLKGTWTGQFLCSDSMSGYNVFDKDGAWTGKHIK